MKSYLRVFGNDVPILFETVNGLSEQSSDYRHRAVVVLQVDTTLCHINKSVQQSDSRNGRPRADNDGTDPSRQVIEVGDEGRHVRGSVASFGAAPVVLQQLFAVDLGEEGVLEQRDLARYLQRGQVQDVEGRPAKDLRHHRRRSRRRGDVGRLHAPRKSHAQLARFRGRNAKHKKIQKKLFVVAL
jgi:hypothetical protein